MTYFGFILIAIGFLIQNESVNIFYTFTNTYILMIGEWCLGLGRTIINNLPLIFMIYLVCKKANSGVPIALALIGYFSFMITTAIFAPQALSTYAYANSSGINTISPISGISKYPLETGMIGSFIVAYITRYSFIRSRHRTAHSVLGFLHKDSAALIYNVVFCIIAGMGISYIFPFIYTGLSSLVTYISKDLSDPYRLAIYGVFDRVLSILGLGNFIRYPFWFTAMGGSYQSLSGQAIVGDVNIWNLTKDSITTYRGAGRFITPYYAINMFIIPALYLGIYSSISGRQEKVKYAMPIALGIILSVVAGNPLPLEMILVFTSPVLLLAYLIVVGAVFAYMSFAEIYLGSNIAANASPITALPGNFPDFIINLRSVIHYDSLLKIVLIGLIAGAVIYLFARLYYRTLTFNLINSNRDAMIVDQTVEALGGYDNVESVGSGFFRVNFNLFNNENASIEKLQALGVNTITETKTGIAIEFGSSSYIISKMVRNVLKEFDR